MQTAIGKNLLPNGKSERNSAFPPSFCGQFTEKNDFFLRYFETVSFTRIFYNESRKNANCFLTWFSRKTNTYNSFLRRNLWIGMTSILKPFFSIILSSSFVIIISFSIPSVLFANDTRFRTSLSSASSRL